MSAQTPADDTHPTLQTFADAHGTTDAMPRPIEITEPEPDEWGFDTDGVAIAIPEQFVAQYGHCETLADALAAAEQAPTTTDTDELARCPRCYSQRVVSKPGYDSQHTQPGTLVCTDCRAHLGIPGGAGSFDGDCRPVDPRREIIPVEVGDAARYHVADGCTPSGATEKLTAAEVIGRGLDPCEADGCQPDVQYRDCDQCGAPTFNAVAGIPLAVCADCVEVSGDE